MKKMYFMAVLSIIITALVFLFFYRDENITCINFLKAYGYETENRPLYSEAYLIPSEFDASLLEYNLMQLSQGFDLSPYKGKNALRYTYKITNCDEISSSLYANIICVNAQIVSADLMNPKMDGFILPVIYRSDLIKYQSPAKNDAVTP